VVAEILSDVCERSYYTVFVYVTYWLCWTDTCQNKIYPRNIGGGGLSLRVYVYVCVNYVTHVLFESCFERMCKASFLRGAFWNVRKPPCTVVVRVVRFLPNLGMSTDLVQLPNMRFNKNTCSSSRFKSRTHTCGRTDGHGYRCVCVRACVRVCFSYKVRIIMEQKIVAF
jgi:hypothetical protein